MKLTEIFRNVWSVGLIMSLWRLIGAPGECGHEQCLNTKFKLCSNSVQTMFIVCSNNVQIQTLFIHCSNSLPKIQTLFIVCSGPRPLKMLYSYFIQTLFILQSLKFILSSNSFEKFKLCSNFIQNSNFVQTQFNVQHIQWSKNWNSNSVQTL